MKRVFNFARLCRDTVFGRKKGDQTNPEEGEAIVKTVSVGYLLKILLFSFICIWFLLWFGNYFGLFDKFLK